ncbi:MAG: hypothetical protein HY319_04815 [Armatimonadetes bacterium]|nr:hypothetical protein [Armatimonadota bacterium]
MAPASSRSLPELIRWFLSGEFFRWLLARDQLDLAAPLPEAGPPGGFRFSLAWLFQRETLESEAPEEASAASGFPMGWILQPEPLEPADIELAPPAEESLSLGWIFEREPLGPPEEGAPELRRGELTSPFWFLSRDRLEPKSEERGEQS